MTKKVTLIVLCLTAFISGCKKYEENSLFNFHSKKARFANTWVLNQYLLNTKDLTEGLAKKNELFVLETTKEGAFSKYYPGASGFLAKGQWLFSDDLKNVSFISTTNKTEVFTIKRLEEKNLHLVKYSNNNKTKEDFYFKPY